MMIKTESEFLQAEPSLSWLRARSRAGGLVLTYQSQNLEFVEDEDLAILTFEGRLSTHRQYRDLSSYGLRAPTAYLVTSAVNQWGASSSKSILPVELLSLTVTESALAGTAVVRHPSYKDTWNGKSRHIEVFPPTLYLPAAANDELPSLEITRFEAEWEGDRHDRPDSGV